MEERSARRAVIVAIGVLLVGLVLVGVSAAIGNRTDDSKARKDCYVIGLLAGTYSQNERDSSAFAAAADDAKAKGCM